MPAGVPVMDVSLKWFEGVVKRAREAVGKQPTWQWFLILTLAVTGARVGEVVGNAEAGVEGLRLQDFEVDRDPAVVKVVTEKVRGRPVRYVPLPPWYVPLLDRYVLWNGVGDKLFNISYQYAWREVKRLTGRNPHALRHGFALYALWNGMNPEVLRRVMGHTTTRMTFQYMNAVGLDPTQLRSPFNE